MREAERSRDCTNDEIRLVVLSMSRTGRLSSAWIMHVRNAASGHAEVMIS